MYKTLKCAVAQNVARLIVNFEVYMSALAETVDFLLPEENDYIIQTVTNNIIDKYYDDGSLKFLTSGQDN